MKIDKKVLVGMFFLVGILMILITVSAYSRSNPQLTSSGSSVGFLRGQGIDTFPIFNEEMCNAGQDFVVQIAPFGCTPAVVRSDLLEEQNVPVFCQLSATKINPLIKVEAIDFISFQGKYPEGISGVGFHPARAAIRSTRTLLNSPVLGNIGYVVLLLKQQPNESAMPDFISGDLTASIRYDIQNAFGIGKATHYLPEFDEDQWERNFERYGFWDGRAFLRAEGISSSGETAVISLYLDKENKLSTFTLREGETSNDIFLPGFQCLAGLRIRLDSLENPNTRARLDINGETFEVAKREEFLENNCNVRDLRKKGVNEEVEIGCRTDEGFDRFILKISPKIKLEIDGNEKKVSVGDFLYKSEDGEKSVYLVHVGTTENSNNLDDLSIWLVSLPEHKDELSEAEISDANILIRQLSYERVSSFKPVDIAADFFKKVAGAIRRVWESLVKEKDLYQIDFMDEKFMNEKGEICIPSDFSGPPVELSNCEQSSPFGGGGYTKIFSKFQGKIVRIVGFSKPVDKTFENAEFKRNFENAMSDYRKIISSFPLEKQDENSQETYGERALIEVIRLASRSEQKETLLDLCREFEKSYPEKKTRVSTYCVDEITLSNEEVSSHSILINGRIKTITFEGIYEPSLEDYSAEIRIKIGNDKPSLVTLRKNDFFYLSGDRKEFIQLEELEQDSAVLRTNFKGARDNILTDTITLKEDIGRSSGGYTFTLTKVNLKKVAKVSVLPNIKNAGTEVNFSFKIGIEKRAIQLSPDKIQDRLESLNKSIKRWEGISDNLGDVVRGFNVACLAIGTTLTVKNLIGNFDGRSIARQEVMRSSGGWINVCQDAVSRGEFSSIDSCLLEHNSDIERDVNLVEKIIKNQSGITRDNVEEKLPEVRKLLGNSFTNPDNENQVIDTSSDSDVGSAFTKTGFDGGKVTLTQLRDVERLRKVLDSNPNSELKKLAERKLYKILSDIKENSESFSIYSSIQSEVSPLGLGVNAYGGENSIEGVYSGGLIAGSKIKGVSFDANTQYPTEIIIYKNRKYVVLLDGEGSRYNIGGDGSWIYRYNGVSNNGNLLVEPIIPVGLSAEEAAQKVPILVQEQNEIRSIFREFIRYDRTLYKNTFKDPRVRYFETSPYKGLPAIVPFDLDKGWYAATKQTLPGFGALRDESIRGYYDSGEITSFYLCNVGENGREEFNSGIRDDICEGFNPGLGQIYNIKFPGLSQSETNSKVSEALGAIEDASRQYGQNNAKILSRNVPIGAPAVGLPDVQCQDFMSPKECLLLFNSCDPVVCPSSRCDLGGTYPVSDVIQSGIIGSIALCLPNAKEGIAVPICLTGIKAGIDSLTSVQKNYRDCLQTNLETGETVGLCDEIHSIYLCDFIWSQTLPLSQIIIPKALEFATGQTGRGGGEYLGVQSAWQSASDSVDYLTNYYGAASFEAFKTGIVKEVGNAVCKNFISATYPDVDFIDSLIEPESPPQYTAWFSEQEFSTVTVPPTSRYKVFYHIYAGENRGGVRNTGAYYNIFLRAPVGSSFFRTNPTLIIASGYIPPGEFASETRDFTGVSGYQELCVSVNGKEECGFNRVTTDFGLDYLNELYLQEQASQTSIKNENECISGTPSIYSLINPNLQAGVQDVINPSLYREQIVRVCSTDNPGQGTDPFIGTQESRWIEVGTCDQSGNLKCYLDQDSVKKNIKSTRILNETLGEVQGNYLEQLFKENEFINFDDEREKIREMNAKSRVNYISEKLIERAFFNHEKAGLLLLRANAYTELALRAIGIKSEISPPPTPGKKTLDEEPEDAEEPISEEEVVREETERIQETKRTYTITSVNLGQVNDKVILSVDSGCSVIRGEIKSQDELFGFDFLNPDDTIIESQVDESAIELDFSKFEEGKKYYALVSCYDEFNVLQSSKKSNIITIEKPKIYEGGSAEAS